MPELPEIHTIVTDLKKYAIGAKIKDVKVTDRYNLNVPTQDFRDALVDSFISDAQRVAKNIVLKTSLDFYVVLHLAMTGRFLLQSPDQPATKWERVIFELEKRGRPFHLRFSDRRMFGKVELHTQESFEKFAKKYGPEPLNAKLSADEFLQRLQKKKSNVKNVLMDQSIIAGMGNAYVNDTLWLAKINPLKNTKDLSLNDVERLLKAARLLLNEGIKNRGISMSDYVDLLGKKGRQQDFFRVYKQNACPECGNAVSFLMLNGRGTYFCPICQA